MKTYTINPATHKVVALDSDAEMTTAFARVFNVNRQRESFNPAYRAMIAAAPEYPADSLKVLAWYLPNIQMVTTSTSEANRWNDAGRKVIPLCALPPAPEAA